MTVAHHHVHEYAIRPYSVNAGALKKRSFLHS